MLVSHSQKHNKKQLLRKIQRYYNRMLRDVFMPYVYIRTQNT